MIPFPKDSDISTCSIKSTHFIEKEINELYEIYINN
jgi:hypothetical protein